MRWGTASQAGDQWDPRCAVCSRDSGGQSGWCLEGQQVGAWWAPWGAWCSLPAGAGPWQGPGRLCARGRRGRVGRSAGPGGGGLRWAGPDVVGNALHYGLWFRPRTGSPRFPIIEAMAYVRVTPGVAGCGSGRMSHRTEESHPPKNRCSSSAPATLGVPGAELSPRARDGGSLTWEGALGPCCHACTVARACPRPPGAWGAGEPAGVWEGRRPLRELLKARWSGARGTRRTERNRRGHSVLRPGRKRTLVPVYGPLCAAGSVVHLTLCCEVKPRQARRENPLFIFYAGRFSGRKDG